MANKSRASKSVSVDAMLGTDSKPEKVESMKAAMTFAVTCIDPKYGFEINRAELVDGKRTMRWYFVHGAKKTESRFFVEKPMQGSVWNLRDSENPSFKIIGCLRTVLYHAMVRDKLITNLSEYETFLKVV